VRSQQTIAQAATVSSFGYWSGQDVTVEFRPAAPHSGIVFVRSDLKPLVLIPARLENRIDAKRRTVLGIGDVHVEMVEHILAALAGLQIDNCEVWVDAAEMPACDGSSSAFVAALDDARIVRQDAARPCLVVTELTRMGTPEAWIEARPAMTGGMTIKYSLDYGPKAPIPPQNLALSVSPEVFRHDLASARTFLLREEAEALRAQGVGQRVSAEDLLIYDEQGPMENSLRFEDECVRHKILDAIGDLSLANCDLGGHFIAYRSGHQLNAELLRVLLKEGEVVTERRRSA
jgi:UDP-3-O-acyl N-acetylglucosamine deacetylase